MPKHNSSINSCPCQFMVQVKFQYGNAHHCPLVICILCIVYTFNNIKFSLFRNKIDVINS